MVLFWVSPNRCSRARGFRGFVWYVSIFCLQMVLLFWGLSHWLSTARCIQGRYLQVFYKHLEEQGEWYQNRSDIKCYCRSSIYRSSYHPLDLRRVRLRSILQFFKFFQETEAYKICCSELELWILYKFAQNIWGQCRLTCLNSQANSWLCLFPVSKCLF